MLDYFQLLTLNVQDLQIGQNAIKISLEEIEDERTKLKLVGPANCRKCMVDVSLCYIYIVLTLKYLN